MYKCFRSSLIGPALQWYNNMPNNYITFFAQLMDTFVWQFSSSKKLEKLLGDLYKVHQQNGEPLYDYVDCFSLEKVSIPFCNQVTTVDAFQKGILSNGELYKEHIEFNWTTMKDVFDRAWVNITWEEDELHHG